MISERWALGWNTGEAPESQSKSGKRREGKDPSLDFQAELAWRVLMSIPECADDRQQVRCSPLKELFEVISYLALSLVQIIY